MKLPERIVAAISIFASGLILGYFMDREPLNQPEPIKEARTYTIGECQIFVDANNVLLDIKCEESKISRNMINYSK